MNPSKPKLNLHAPNMHVFYSSIAEVMASIYSPDLYTEMHHLPFYFRWFLLFLILFAV